MSGEGQAALVQLDLFVAQLQNFGVDELDKLVLVVGGYVLRQIAVIQADEQAAHHTHLRTCQTQAVGVEQRFFHIVEQNAQTVVKFGYGAADLFQDRVAVLHNRTQCHK